MKGRKMNKADPFQIKKHSSLIQIQSGLSLNQRKMINGLIFLIKQRLNVDSSQRQFEVELGILKKISGIKKSDNTDLKQSLQALASITIEYNILGKDKTKWGIFSLFSHVEILVEEKGKRCLIRIECPTIVLDSIKHPQMYSLLNMGIIKKFRSKHSLILYEVLFDYKGIKSIYIDIENLKRLFGIKEDQYAYGYSMFQKRVLEIAISEINKVSDLLVSISTLHKIGRKVMGYTFDIKQLTAKFKDKQTKELAYRLRKHGISSKEVARLLSQYSKETIFNNLNYVQGQVSKGIKIKSLSGLSVYAIANDIAKSDNSEVKERLSTPNQDVPQDAFEEKFQNHCQQILTKRMSSLNEIEYENLFNSYIDGLPQNHFAYKYVQRNEANHPLVLTCFNKYLLDKFLSPEELDFERFKMNSKGQNKE